jgi:hypothetical protein
MSVSSSIADRWTPLPESVMRAGKTPFLLALALVLGAAPAPLGAQSRLTNLSAQELYTAARERAAKVTDRCRDRQNYLEAMTYLFAYYQVASRDGSLQTAPDFDRTLQQKYSTVLRVVHKCLDLDRNASASMRDDGTGPVIAPPPPVERVDLPNPPAAGAVVIATDDQGRTISQLRAIIDRFPQERASYRAEITRVEQQRDALAAELASLRNRQPTPPPPPPPPLPPANLNGEYRIRVMANGLFWHEDGNGDRKLSTRWQPNDDFTRFILEAQADGSYRIRVKASGRYLHAPGHEDWIVSTLAQVDDDYTRFIIVPEPDGTTFRLRQKATGRFLGVRSDGILTNNPQADDNFMRFRLIR